MVCFQYWSVAGGERNTKNDSGNNQSLRNERKTLILRQRKESQCREDNLIISLISFTKLYAFTSGSMNEVRKTRISC